MGATQRTFTNNGLLTSSKAAGTVTVQSAGSLGLSGSGSITETGGGAATVRLQVGGANAFTISGILLGTQRRGIRERGICGASNGRFDCDGSKHHGVGEWREFDQVEQSDRDVGCKFDGYRLVVER